MTQEEAEKIAEVIATADHSCFVCVSDLCDKLNHMDLGFRWELGGPDFSSYPRWEDDRELAKTYAGVVAIIERNDDDQR